MEILRIVEKLEAYARTTSSVAGDDAFSETMSEAAQLLVKQGERIADLEERNRWIPVTERFPELIPCGAGTAYSEAVNVLTEGSKVLTAIWNGTCFICDEEFWEAWGEKITHWAPVLLPLPKASWEDAE